jgi:hypothetical protein
MGVFLRDNPDHVLECISLQGTPLHTKAVLELANAFEMYSHGLKVCCWFVVVVYVYACMRLRFPCLVFLRAEIFLGVPFLTCSRFGVRNVVCVCVCVWMWVRTCVFASLYLFLCVFVYVFVYVCVFVDVSG